MEDDFLIDAKEELKRAEHLIYVSLKYTRTVDVIKSVVERLISTFDFVIDGLLESAKEKGKIEDLPQAPTMKAEEIKKTYADDSQIVSFMDLYLLFRKISRAEFTRAREFRRHVTMTALVDEQYIEIDIDIITDYYKRTCELLEYVQSITSSDKE